MEASLDCVTDPIIRKKKISFIFHFVFCTKCMIFLARFTLCTSSINSPYTNPETKILVVNNSRKQSNCEEKDKTRLLVSGSDCLLRFMEQ